MTNDESRGNDEFRIPQGVRGVDSRWIGVWRGLDICHADFFRYWSFAIRHFQRSVFVKRRCPPCVLLTLYSSAPVFVRPMAMSNSAIAGINSDAVVKP